MSKPIIKNADMVHIGYHRALKQITMLSVAGFAHIDGRNEELDPQSRC